ncbi:DSD1 family PLP-dependent enzyme [Bacillus subtilis]|uniref:DSD1 family PLP-dependent enzyme n=1 Tax=Pseudochrobactrum asaccharolyticum TaxID=354351 RepID=UPI001F3DAED2|nr:DSD1 family PLP-dependent enzyme [Pseudochrobactrum asaccharolyticum]MCF7646329.1 DSD1 family PLP-dependent enzyme [Pseudochrobactrum asaccharolyticum]MCF7673295.1 DSD1 family PLP-dependent enzyme [Bacillus subtilis]
MGNELYHNNTLRQSTSKYQLNTPALILDLDQLEQNITTMADFMLKSGRKLRPHAKSHKCIKIAEKQIQAGAAGVCCATLDEAEIMCASGIRGIHITSPVTSALKIDRLVELARQSPDMMIVVDHPQNVAALALATKKADISLNVIIDIELGFGRTGVISADAAEALAQTISSHKTLNYCGIQAYGGHLQHITDYQTRLQKTRQAHDYINKIITRLSAIDMAPAIVTGGGTGTHMIDAKEGPFTEIQAGSYIFMDAEYRGIECSDHQSWTFNYSLFVQTTIISKNYPDMASTDAGTKAFALNGPLPRIVTAGYQSLSYEYTGDEHGRIRTVDNNPLPAIGETIECVIPHCDPTVALYDNYHCIRQNQLVDIWPVDARGRRS